MGTDIHGWVEVATRITSQEIERSAVVCIDRLVEWITTDGFIRRTEKVRRRDALDEDWRFLPPGPVLPALYVLDPPDGTGQDVAVQQHGRQRAAHLALSRGDELCGILESSNYESQGAC